MSDEFQALFEKVISLWPDSLDTSKKVLHENGGASIPILMSVHDEIVNKLEAMSDNHSLIHMDWAIYTAIHQSARARDQTEPRSVDVETVRHIFERNLKLERKSDEESGDN